MVRKGDTVLVVGIHSNGSAEHPGLVTRVWPAMPLDVDRVNVTVFPDEGLATPRQSVPYYASLEAANQAHARMPFCYPHR